MKYSPEEYAEVCEKVLEDLRLAKKYFPGYLLEPKALSFSVIDDTDLRRLLYEQPQHKGTLACLKCLQTAESLKIDMTTFF